MTTEHAEDPVADSSGRAVQWLSLVTMAAEAMAQRTQQRAATAAAADQATAGALRATHTAAHATARLQWEPVLGRRAAHPPDQQAAGLAWAASQPYRHTDPQAQLASDRATQQLRELRPDVMARFDRLTATGLDPVEAMRRVAPFMDAPARHTPGQGAADQHAPGQGSAAQAAGTGVPQDPAGQAATAAHTADSQQARSHQHSAVPDDPATPTVDVHQQTRAAAQPDADTAAGLHADTAAGAAGAVPPGPRLPPQVAADGYPEPLTGLLLAGGHVKPKPPDRTAPAQVRSTGLRTAARAARSR